MLEAIKLNKSHLFTSSRSMLAQLYFKFHCDGLSAPMQLYHSLIGLREAGKK